MVEILRRIEPKGFDALMTAPVYHVHSKSAGRAPEGLIVDLLKRRDFFLPRTRRLRCSHIGRTEIAVRPQRREARRASRRRRARAISRIHGRVKII
jgi:hypothetical protein